MTTKKTAPAKPKRKPTKAQPSRLDAAKATRNGKAGHRAARAGCAPWCGLPLSDARVPIWDEPAYFATEAIDVDSPAYCCPQRAEDRPAPAKATP